MALLSMKFPTSFSLYLIVHSLFTVVCLLIYLFIYLFIFSFKATLNTSYYMASNFTFVSE
jgi:hypothetical protein